MRPSIWVAATGLVMCLGVAGCTSSSQAGDAASTASTATTPAAASGTPVAPATLAATLRTGLAGVTSAHVALSTAIAGSSSIAGAGDVALSDGKIAEAAIGEQLPSGLGTVQIVAIGSTTYAKLPAGFSRQDKPWTKLSTSNSSALISQLAGTVDGLLAVASPSTVVELIGAASGTVRVGSATVAGQRATHYVVTVPASKLARLPGGLSVGRASSLAVDVWVDSAGRPVQLHGSLLLDGTRVTPTITLTDFDRPVQVSAPPASQVSG